MPDYKPAVIKIQLVEFTGTLISKTNDDVCFEVEIGGNKFREFFPLSKAWLNNDNPNIIHVHKDLAIKKGLLGYEKKS